MLNEKKRKLDKWNDDSTPLKKRKFYKNEIMGLLCLDYWKIIISYCPCAYQYRGICKSLLYWIHEQKKCWIPNEMVLHLKFIQTTHLPLPISTRCHSFLNSLVSKIVVYYCYSKQQDQKATYQQLYTLFKNCFLKEHETEIYSNADIYQLVLKALSKCDPNFVPMLRLVYYDSIFETLVLGKQLNGVQPQSISKKASMVLNQKSESIAEIKYFPHSKLMIGQFDEYTSHIRLFFSDAKFLNHGIETKCKRLEIVFPVVNWQQQCWGILAYISTYLFFLVQKLKLEVSFGYCPVKKMNWKEHTNDFWKETNMIENENRFHSDIFYLFPDSWKYESIIQPPNSTIESDYPVSRIEWGKMLNHSSLFEDYTFEYIPILEKRNQIWTVL